MTESFARELEERLVRYVQIDTTSDENSPTSPSTERQYDLLNLLVEELKEIGASDVTLTDYGAVIATVPATSDADIPTVAFLAHVDTTAGFSGEGVKPRVHRSYDGGEITYPDDPSLVLSPETNPYLKEKVGEDIVTAFNPHYLLAGLGALTTDFVRLSFTHPSKPAVLTGQGTAEGESEEEFRYLLMPIRFAG